MKTYRNGDISLHEVEKVEGEIVEHEGKFVLALGEQTGHSHVLTVDNPNDLTISQDKDGRYFFELKSMGTITHEEHKTIEVLPGKYEMKREREFNYFQNSVQRVAD